MRSVALFLLAAAAGCYSPRIENGQLRCDQNGGVCPAGFSCQAGTCWRDGESPTPDLAVPSEDGGAADLSVTDPPDLSSLSCVGDIFSCKDAVTPQRCIGGGWVAQPACDGATPVCVEGQCVACRDGDTEYVNATTIRVCSGNLFQEQTCPTAQRAANVDTGRCYNPDWAVWPMPPESGADYTIGTDTVRDNITHLVWQRGRSSTLLNHANALAYCANLGALDGLTGWRLPSHIELVSLLKIPGTGTVRIDDGAFPGTPAATFASSSTDGRDPTRAWAVSFSTGSGSAAAKNTAYEVRCVR